MKKHISFIFALTIILSSCTSLKPSFTGTFTDQRDGKVYHWVKLKNQIWMAQNLDYQTDGALYSTKSTEQKTIGNLYFGNYTTNLAPSGWHIPTDDEWQELEIAAGTPQGEASQNNYRGSVESDFLKGGSTKFNVLFTGFENYKSARKSYEFVKFWSSTRILNSYLTRSFRTDDFRIGKVMHGINNSAYVRCLKNDTTTAGLVIDIPVKKQR